MFNEAVAASEAYILCGQCHGNDYSGTTFDSDRDLALAEQVWKEIGLFAVGGGVGLGAKGAYSLIRFGGSSFTEYKALYWSTRVKSTLEPLVNRQTGQVWKQYNELHHRFIPQRWKWAPNWLMNNRINLAPASSLQHAQMDLYRARFAPRWVKDAYKLNWR